MSPPGMLLLILLLLLPLATCDRDGQAIPRDGDPSAVSGPVTRLLRGFKERAQSDEVCKTDICDGECCETGCFCDLEYNNKLQCVCQ
nr:conotoxin N M15.3 [Conus magus]